MTSLSRRWAAALDEFAAAQLDAGRSAATVRGYRDTLSALARATGVPHPFALTPADLAAHLDACASAATRKKRASVARVFYGWATQTGRAATDPTAGTGTQQRRRPDDYPHADAWGAALADFAHGHARGGLAPAPVDRAVRHVRRFAAGCQRAPYDVSADDVAAWLDAQQCTRPARHAYATSLRTFYRWAYRAGRVETDPTDSRGPHPLRKTPPAIWGPLLAEFRRWTLSAGKSTQTSRLQAGYVAKLARETGARHPGDLDSQDLADWLSRHHWARETLRAARTSLRSFYRWAAESGYVETNPAERLPVVRVSPPVPRPAGETEYADALRNASPRAALMLRLAGEFGLRRAEIARIHRRDLSQDSAGEWWLTVHGKGDKRRRIPLTPDMATALRNRGDGYAFPGPSGRPLTPATVGKLTTDLLPPGTSLHHLRHRFATRAYALNHDVFTLQRILGHASPQTTQRYVYTDDTTLRGMVDAVAALR